MDPLSDFSFWSSLPPPPLSPVWGVVAKVGGRPTNSYPIIIYFILPMPPRVLAWESRRVDSSSYISFFGSLHPHPPCGVPPPNGGGWGG
jgi:hypothetical protein